MKKQERMDLKEKLENDFITDFGLEYLSPEEKEQAIKTAYIATVEQLEIGEYGSYDITRNFFLASACTQNFHILKSIKENNDKLDTLIEQNKSLIELLSKDK